MSDVTDKRAGLTPEELRFSEAVARKLPAAKRSKGEVAESAGVTRGTLYALKKAPFGVSLRNVVGLCRELGIDVAREVLGEAQRPPSSGVTVDREDFATLPLVAEGIAAGFGAVAEVLDEPRPYAFRADWPALKGMAADPLRFVLFRLRDDADSMTPEIRPGALVLCDRSEGVRLSPLNGVPYLVVTERPDRVAVKRVLPVRDGEKIRALVYHSTNPLYPPVSMDLKRGERIQDLVRARVVWWATTVE